MLEVSQMNAKNLREEVLIRAKTMADQGNTITQLKAELDQLKSNLSSRQNDSPDRLQRYVDEFAQESYKLNQETESVVRILQQREDFNRISEEDLMYDLDED